MEQKFYNIDLKPLSPFVGPDEEIPKSDIIQRCAGWVDISLLNTLKLFAFSRAGKDHFGNLYLL